MSSKPQISREQFIQEYLDRSNIPAANRTKDGYRFVFSDYVSERVAVRCDCDHPTCKGWAMTIKELED